MALLMFDGFEAYDTAYDVTSGGNWKVGGYAFSTPARTGLQSARIFSSVNLITKDFADPAMLICGAGLAYDDLVVHECLAFYGDQGNTVASLEKTSNAGTLVVKDGAGTVLFTSGEVFTGLNTFHYIEFKAHINGASGQLALRVDGVELYDSGPIDIQAGASVGIRSAEFGPGNIGSDSIYIDDVYFCDNTGATHNDFLGPVRVTLLAPTSDASVAWTPNAGATNYTQVDDTGASIDGDTTYVSTSTVGAKDLYGLGDLAAELANPLAVQVFLEARHDDGSGGAAIAPLLKSGVTEDEGAQVALPSSYRFLSSTLYDVDPDTGVEWTVAGVNGLQAGVIFKANL